MTPRHRKRPKGKQLLGIATLVLGLAGICSPQNAHATASMNQQDQRPAVVRSHTFYCDGYWSDYPCRPFFPSYGGYPWFPPHYPWFPPHYPWFHGGPSDFHGGPGGPSDFHGGPGGPSDFHGGPGGPSDFHGGPGGPSDFHGGPGGFYGGNP